MYIYIILLLLLAPKKVVPVFMRIFSKNMIDSRRTTAMLSLNFSINTMDELSQMSFPSCRRDKCLFIHLKHG